MIVVENKILQLVNKHKHGEAIGLTSICSANLHVIKAAILNAKKYSQILLIESTSNQVDQFGGYTGITPQQFRKIVFDLATALNFPIENIILGGDHLGPNRWQNEISNSAMQKAKDQIAAYVSAGYTKIHLDASMKCADDGDEQIPLDPFVIAERSAILCKAAEDVFTKYGNDGEPPVYVIGTDVPPPGGAKEHHNKINVTSAEEVEETIDLTKKAFEKYNLSDAWNRVVAVVVQPGVEFGDSIVFDYERTKSKKLVDVIETKSNLVYEAHSTDYQKKELLKQMVEDHFAILKVGPWLTFAFREAVFALSLIEKELLSNKKGITLSNLFEVIEERMIVNPKYWEKYYDYSEEENKISRKFSYSDRIRYYWIDNFVNESLQRLISNLTNNKIPHTLLSQYLPVEYFAVKENIITENPEEIILNKIDSVLGIYNYATYGGTQ
ncbi:MAG: class II D-tagatose-bisphosphate aldolase, non-catalytic subunit [Ignavibacteriaceae bacterium]